MTYSILFSIVLIFQLAILAIKPTRNLFALYLILWQSILIFLKDWGMSPDDIEYQKRILMYANNELNFSSFVVEPGFSVLTNFFYLIGFSAVASAKLFQIISLSILNFAVAKYIQSHAALLYAFCVFFPVQQFVLLRTGFAISLTLLATLLLLNNKRVRALCIILVSVLMHKQTLLWVGISSIQRTFGFAVKRYSGLFLLSFLILTANSPQVSKMIVDYLANRNAQIAYYRDLSDGHTFGTTIGFGLRTYILFTAYYYAMSPLVRNESSRYLLFSIIAILVALMGATLFAEIPVLARRIFEYGSIFSILLFQCRSKGLKTILLGYAFASFFIEIYVYPLSDFGRKLL